MASSTVHNGPARGYEEALRKMEEFVSSADCLQGISANRDDFLLRLEALSIQRKNLEGALLIVILGGTGVGKSTTINAIAGEELARVSPIRPCTTALTFYSHSENDPSLIDAVLKEGDRWKPTASPGLRQKILVDPPDFDSMMLSNRRKLLEVLRVADLILCVVDREKYRNHSLYRLLSRFREGRSFLFLLNKSDYGVEKAVVDDFREALTTAGINQPRIFVGSARHAFNAKTGAEASSDTGDFPALEDVIRNEIDKAEIDRIKQSNFSTLLRNTYELLERAVPPRLVPELDSLPEWTGNLARETASRVASEVSRTLVVENDTMRRFVQTASSLPIGGVFGLYLAISEKLMSLFAPRLTGSRALDPPKLRAEVRKALDQTDTARIEILIDRFAAEVATKLGAMGVRLDSPGVKELSLNKSAMRREIIQKTEGVAGEAMEAFVERSSKGWWKNIAYNVLPLACLAYFAWLAVLRIGRGEMIDLSFLLTFLVFFVTICMLQHVVAERGFRHRGGRFMRELEKAVGELARETIEEPMLPQIRAFSDSLSSKVRNFLATEKLIP